MDEFNKIEKAFDVILDELEKVSKRKLTTFGRAALEKFTTKASNLAGESINLKFETGG